MRKQAFGLVNGVEEKPLGTPAAAAPPRGVQMCVLAAVTTSVDVGRGTPANPRRWIGRGFQGSLLRRPHLRPGLAAVVAFSNLPLRNGWLEPRPMLVRPRDVAQQLASVIQARELGRKWAFSYIGMGIFEFKCVILTEPTFPTVDA
ncbi:hypothetical protein Landi51_10660 [Colletotrichum acutatum]